MKAYFVQEKKAGKWASIGKRSLMRTYDSKREARKDIRSYLRRHKEETTADYRILALTVR